jgi:16S rRNA (cytosine967-C5)-methyltransferase
MTDAFKKGFFEVQDANSQLGCFPWCSQECVVDTCAGAGGKTLHIAALMETRLLLLWIYTKVN